MTEDDQRKLTEYEAEEERIKRTTRKTQRLATALAAAGMAAAVPSALIPIFGKFDIQIAPMEQPVAAAASVKEIASLKLQVLQLKNDLAHLNITISDDAPSVALKVALENIQRRISEIEKRQAALDNIILDNPSKALELPLLKRDVETVRQSNEQSITAIRQSVDQIYDLNKWLLGSMAVGVICLALSHFFRRKVD
ncbi:hypothetical protein [Sphingobium sp. HWE2-09]|uniref:hypothetical protein n=1 Tax=Sphingobium sp. HWE2-09 TaxID=3108390 RepID=UPI002DD2686E|nr:hypothetical protein [Sphingobium sp. HWE2-09]